MAKFKVELPGSEHTGENAVQIKLSYCPDDDRNRLADVILSSDGMQVKIHMMESDLRILAYAIINETRADLDGERY